MPARKLLRRFFRRRVQQILFGGIAIVCLVATVALMAQVFARLGGYGGSGYDNIAWTTSRLETDHIKLLRAMDHVTTPTSPEMQELRRRFDAFYSRVVTFHDSAAYRAVFDTMSTRADLALISETVKTMADIIDAGDAEIIRRKPALLEAAQSLDGPIQNLIEAGVTASATRTVAERSSLISSLTELIALNLLMLLALFSLLLLFFRLYRRYRRRARDNRAILNRQATILNTSSDAVLVVAKDSRIVDTNAAANAIFGLGSGGENSTLVSQCLLRRESDNSLSPVSGEQLRQACAAGPNRCSSLVAIGADGRKFPVEMSADKAVRAGQDVCVCFIRDISRRAAADAEIRAARDKAQAGERAKARFVGIMSHEMRTPLNGMLGALDLLASTDMTDEQAQYTRIMKSSGQLLLNQINDALDITRAGSGNLAISPDSFDLDALLDELVQNQQTAATAHNCTITRLGANRPVGLVTGDRTRLFQVLLNLLSNAIKFTRDGQITLEAALCGDTDDLVEIQVADTGIGISKEDLPRVFDDFVRLGGADAPEAQGSGLGLGIARQLVTLMGGTIGAESLPGEGSLFWITLPLPAVDQSLPAKADHSAPAPGPALDILIVEDNETNRQVLSAMLRKAGHHVTLASDGAQGLAVAATRRFDLILMDITMPGLDGIEATRQIRAGDGPCATTRIVALTAHHRPDKKSRLATAGFDAVETKPLRAPDLQALVTGVRPTATQPRTAALVDASVLKQLGAVLSETRVSRLIDGFRHEGTTLLADLPALQAGPADVLAARLHRLAGTSAAVGALALQASLCRAETAALGGHAHDLDNALAALPDLWQETLRHIDQPRQAA